ncbi:MAG: PTS sugar transporter subunit IIA [Parachlamydiales bacterium]|nr:PTS sugar transporter subunit IIA [Parachlamydiales bacterium]
MVFLHSKNRNEVIWELIDSLSKTQKINDKESFFNKVLQREKIVSTGIGLGVAIPHAKSDEFKDFFIAIGIQNECKIKWQSIDKIPVRIVFLIGGPESKQTEYLKILSILTTAIKDETVRKDLINASSKEEILTIINHF